MNDSNILAILGVAQKEDVISNLLANLIKHVPGFGRKFLELVLDGYTFDTDDTGIQVRKKLGDLGIPDLIIRCSDNTRAVLLENKLTAGEGQGQTERYAGEDNRSDLLSAIHGDCRSVEFVYLSLFPHNRPSDPSFKHITYDRLVDLLSDCSKDAPRPQADLMRDLAAVLSAFYDRRNVDWEAGFRSTVENRDDGDPLDGRFFSFLELVEQAHSGTNLKTRGRWIGNDRGRPEYGCQVSRSGWERPVPDRRSDFQARKHFYVHFEPKYHRLSSSLEVPIHFETSPYMTKSRFQKDVPSKVSREEWHDLRRQFREELLKTGITRLQGFSRRQGRLQICKFTIDVENATNREVRNRLASTFTDVSPMIDETLASLQLEVPQ
jgi:hypothetical protein